MYIDALDESTVTAHVADSTIEGSDLGIRNTNDPGHLFITNSTISGNGHGVDNGDDVAAGGSVNFTHTTVTNNGRGIFTEESAYTNINRTILADNDIDCAGEAPGSTSYNVVGVDCGISASTADIIGTIGSPVPTNWKISHLPKSPCQD